MLSKKELQVFLFSWLKTFKQSLIIFVTYFWWLISLNVLLTQYTSTYMGYNTPFTQISLEFITMILRILLLYFSVLSIRASIETKNFSYFFSNPKRLLGFSFMYILLNAILFLVSIVPTTITFLATKMISGPLNESLFFYWLFWSTSTLLVIFGAFWFTFLKVTTFFFFDSYYSIASIWNILKRSSKGFFAYIGLFTSLIAMHWVTAFLLALTYFLIPRFLSLTFSTIFNFFFTCAVSILYLKVKHSNPKIFLD
jgi:hypothetical protein